MNIKAMIFNWAREKGFKVRGNYAVLESDDCWLVFRSVKSRFSDRYFLDAGAALKVIQPKPDFIHCGIDWHLSARLDDLADNRMLVLRAMDLEEDFSDERRAEIILDALEQAWEKHLKHWLHQDTLIKVGVMIVSRSSSIGTSRSMKEYLKARNLIQWNDPSSS